MNLKNIKIGKLNILDIVIILVIAVFIGVFAFSKINSSDNNAVATGNSSVNSKFTYTISVKGISETGKDVIKIGDEVYDKVSSTYIGKIVDLNITEAKGVLEKDNGEMLVKNIPGKIDIDLKIETDGTIKNGDYLANGLIRVLVGNFKEIKTKYIMFP